MNRRISLLHTHYIPEGLAKENCLKDVIIIPSLTAENNMYYYKCPLAFKNIHDFICSWDKLAQTFLSTDVNVYFAIEDILLLEDIEELKRLIDEHDKFLIVQLYHSKKNKYFNLFDGITQAGLDLFYILRERGLILDISHITGKNVVEVANHFEGKTIVSHCVCGDILSPPNMRANALSRQEIGCLSKKGVYFGIPLVNDLVSVNGFEGDGTCDSSIADVVNQFEIFADIIGDTEQLCIGPDYLNFNFLSRIFRKSINIVPELDTLYGFSKLEFLLMKRGFSNTDIDNIFNKNISRLLT